MSLLVAKGNIVAALPMKGWHVCICILYTTHYHHHHHYQSCNEGMVYRYILYNCSLMCVLTR